VPDVVDINGQVLLTGTPLQNNLEELFNLMAFLTKDATPSQVCVYCNVCNGCNGCDELFNLMASKDATPASAYRPWASSNSTRAPLE